MIRPGWSSSTAGLQRVRSVGRVASLTDDCATQQVHGNLGIAHTRWATHGAPSEANAHPHVSGGLAVVHNGIIENHDALRTRLKAEGFVFTSETDTEVIVHLVELHFRQTQGPARRDPCRRCRTRRRLRDRRGE